MVKPNLGSQRIEVRKVEPPAYELRLPSPVLAAVFSLFAVYLFIQGWSYFQLYPYMADVIRETVINEYGKLVPKFPGFFIVWGGNIMSMILLAVFEIGSWNAGRQAFLWSTGRIPRGLLGLLFSVAIGNGIWGTVALGLGFLGLIGGIVFGGLLSASLALVAWRLKKSWKPVEAGSRFPRLPSLHELGMLEKGLIAFCVYILGYNLLPSLQPEWFYDSLVCHMAIPARWLQEHRVCDLPDTFFASFAFLQQMQYMVFMALGNDICPRLLHWVNGVECMALVYLVSRNILGRSGAILAVAIFAALPPLRFLQSMSMIELGLSRYGALALVAFMISVRLIELEDGKGVSRRSWLFLSAWILGLGHATKYLGIFVSVIIILRMLKESLRGKSRMGTVFADITMIVAWASVWTIPWLAKNWLFTGNPVFPMLGRLFSSKGLEVWISPLWMQDNTHYGTGYASGLGGLMNWIKMPILASVGNGNFGTFSLNAFFILFLPLLIFVKRIPVSIKFMVGCTVVYFIMWSMSSQQIRFFMPIMPLACVATAFVITKVVDGWTLLKIMAVAATSWLFIESFLGEIQNRSTNKSLLPYTTGWFNRTEFYRQAVQYYPLAETVNKTAPKDGRVLFLGAGESYLVERRVICSSIYNRPAAGEMAKKASNPDELREILRRKRVTHIIYQEYQVNEYGRYGIFDWGGEAQDVFTGMLNRYGKCIQQARGGFLFQLTDKPLPVGDRKTGKALCFNPRENFVKAQKLVSMADDLIAQKKYADGLLLVEEVAELLPDSVQGYGYLGYIHGCLGNISEATRYYHKAISLGYPPITAYYNLGMIYRESGRPRDALAVYRMGLSLEPTFIQLMEECADTALSIGENSMALKLYTELAGLAPDKPGYTLKVYEIKKLMRLTP